MPRIKHFREPPITGPWFQAKGFILLQLEITGEISFTLCSVTAQIPETLELHMDFSSPWEDFFLPCCKHVSIQQRWIQQGWSCVQPPPCCPSAGTGSAPQRTDDCGQVKFITTLFLNNQTSLKSLTHLNISHLFKGAPFLQAFIHEEQSLSAFRKR